MAANPKAKSTRKRRRLLSVSALAQRCATSLVSNEPPDFDEALSDTRLSKLFDAVCARVAVYEGADGMPDAFPLFERIRQALPEALKGELGKFDDMRDEELMFTRAAAYDVGVAVGRRLGGGAR